jgi:uncharacterized membrane protein
MTLAIADRGRLWGALLLASLCLNVLLGAFIATRWIELSRAPMITVAPAQLIELVARRLPSADAEVLRRVYRDKAAQFAAEQAEYRRALLAAARLLAEPQLDPAAVRAAVHEARNKRIRIGDLAIDTFLEALPRMSAEGRMGLTRNLRER